MQRVIKISKSILIGFPVIIAVAAVLSFTTAQVATWEPIDRIGTVYYVVYVKNGAEVSSKLTNDEATDFEQSRIYPMREGIKASFVYGRDLYTGGTEILPEKRYVSAIGGWLATKNGKTVLVTNNESVEIGLAKLDATKPDSVATSTNP